MRSLLPILFCLTNVAAAAQNEPPPAEQLLDELTSQLGEPEQGDDRGDTSDELGEALSRYHAALPTLDAETAAKRWLALVEQLASGNANADDAAHVWANEQSGPGFAELLAHLPPPAAWQVLVEQVSAAQEGNEDADHADLALRLVAAALANDYARAWSALDGIELLLQDSDPADRSNYRRHSLSSIRKQLLQFFLDHAQDGDALQRVLQRRVAKQPGADDVGSHSGELQLPDLISLLGEEAARKTLVDLLGNASVSLRITSGSATRRLARELATEHVARLETPQWTLAQGVDTAAMQLYEALKARFDQQEAPADDANDTGGGALSGLLGLFGGASETGQNNAPSHSMHDYARRRAALYYLVGLIVADRSEEAVQIALSLPEEGISSWAFNNAMQQLLEDGQRRAVYEFLAVLLQEHPQIPLWERFVDMAVEFGDGPQVIEQISAMLADETLDQTLRHDLQAHLINAQIALDRIDEALPLLREQLATQHGDSDDRCRRAVRAWRLAQHLDDPELAQQALARFNETIGSVESYNLGSLLGSLAEAMRLHGHFADAVGILKRGLHKALAKQREEGRHASFGFGGSVPRKLLAELVATYHAAGRHDDVLVLLERAPWWNASDLSKLVVESSGHFSIDGAALGSAAAVALLRTDRDDEARAILHAILARNPGHDPSYAALVELDGLAAIPLLDRLFARDQFEERPLIWKAQVLMEDGQLERAEQLARQAIAIDPSDGEQPRGDRMRVYAVLAQIVAAGGDRKQAEVLRGAVRAIRISEDADLLYQAGLVRRAVRQYREALTHFADAYCIQSRLAVQLAQIGEMDAAAEHYRRAFELMPDSFGRMESHCFGCESTFDGELAQSIAEQVFTDYLQESPESPQGHYMLAYLRQQQNRYAEARDGFRAAVTFDPEYINAWKKLGDLHDKIHLDAELRQDIALNLARLDPLGRHVTPTVGDIDQLERLWQQMDEVAELAMVKPERLLPLTAAAAESQQQAAQMHGGIIHRSSHGSDEWSDGWSPPEPAAAVARHDLLQAARALIDDDY